MKPQLDRTAIAPLARRLQACGDAWRRAADWVHPSWYLPLGLQAPDPASDTAVSRFCAAMGLAIPPAQAFDRPAHRLAALPPATLCRVLRARALLRHRPALRRCVEPALRRRLVSWLHPVVFETVLREAAQDMQRDDEGLPLPPCGPRPHPADTLAWEGFCLFERDAVWSDRALLHRLRLGFAQELCRPAALDEFPGARDGSAWVLQRLERFIPEATWLFG
ncbi:hypothetical protein GT347_19695 [Xylophilus rhododendri]|uniref:Type III secretion protein n=1 Tax=Xylophilus rhododendri TaxID=2697032 RepID=A0A857JB89_9BURK|nr:type III secretion protein HrpB4 [Xylophilus rhododendri]QHJ00009.1 hypothetical protein GT347_19695 [Xylophilus rhododendri]